MQWKPTKEGFLRFLVESKVVYDTIERVIQEAPRPECEIPPLRAAMLWGHLKWCALPLAHHSFWALCCFICQLLAQQCASPFLQLLLCLT